MIKAHLIPGMFSMAIAAFLAVAGSMYVIQPVAAIAFLRCIPVLVADMTTVAFQFGMLFPQDKFCFVMIELRTSPVAFCVAVGTLFTQASLVDVILLMAGCTACGRIPVFFSLQMAKTAGCHCMRPPERIVRDIMIKGFDTELDDIRITSLVICMTVSAFTALHTCTPVISLLAGDVSCNCFMTVMAECVLLIPGEW